MPTCRPNMPARRGSSFPRSGRSSRRARAWALKAIVLATEPPVSVAVHWRALGAGKFAVVPMEHTARSTYRVSLPALSGDIEYFVEAKTGDRSVFFPVTAPALNQTVVVMK